MLYIIITYDLRWAKIRIDHNVCMWNLFIFMFNKEEIKIQSFDNHPFGGRKTICFYETGSDN